MPETIYTHMQAAVDIVNTSPHPTNKIAATIAGDGFAISRVNYWPKPIEDHIGREPDIGNSSGTVHAETACILAAMNDGHKTDSASIFITDPPCPNCMKNMAEAGITKLYIDHKGFDKDWAKRRGDSFDNMSMRIAAKAGIDVFVIYRKEERFEVISCHPPGYKPDIDHPAKIDCMSEDFTKCIENANTLNGDEPFALACAHNADNQRVTLTVDRHPTIGYTYETVENKQDKYSFIMQPLNRLLMISAKERLKLDPEHIYTSRCPTSREWVNFIGAGLNSIQIGNKQKARDEHGLRALKHLQASNIIKLT